MGIIKFQSVFSFSELGVLYLVPVDLKTRSLRLLSCLGWQESNMTSIFVPSNYK